MTTKNKISKDFKNYSQSRKATFFQVILKTLLYSNFRAVFLYRIASYLDKIQLGSIAFIIEKIMHFTTNCWIGRRAEIGPGFVIRHVGSIIIGNKTVIGSNCEIRQGVTFGGNLGKMNHDTTQPILGNNILVGAGAKILGPIKIGDNCIIGANAVVIIDIPADSVVGGVPAKVIRPIRKGENPLVDSSKIVNIFE